MIGNVGQVWAYDGTGYVPTSFLLASAVSAYGLTLASAADAAAARTALALGTAAVLNVGTGANNVVQLDGSARLPAVDGSQLTGISGGSVAGSNTQVIYNASGVYAGHSGMTYSSATSRLTVTGGLVAPSMRPASNGTAALQWQNATGVAIVVLDTTNGRLGVGTTPTQLIDAIGSGVVCCKLKSTSATGAASFTAWNDINTSFEFGMWGSTRGGYGAISSGDAYIYGSAAFAITADGAGGIIKFGTGGGIVERMRILANGYVAIGQSSATALLDLDASTTARASLRVRAGTAPTTPNAGDIWYATGDRLKLYRAATEMIASGVPGTGGSATATGTWGATEQAMLQAIYDAGRAFGMIS